jgi:hypothetical protein
MYHFLQKKHNKEAVPPYKAHRSQIKHHHSHNTNEENPKREKEKRTTL